MKEKKLTSNANSVGATSSCLNFEEHTKNILNPCLNINTKLSTNTKGITLIALIITIIVMLILVGVTVNIAINGGLFNITKEATKKTQIEEVKELVQADALGVQSNNMGNITRDELREILDKYFENVPNPLPKELWDLKLTLKKEYGGYTDLSLLDIYDGIELEIDEDTFTIGKSTEIIKQYGDIVKNYTVRTNEFKSGVWRLFYQDDNYTYLITDECIGNYIPKDYYEKYKDGTYVSKVGQKLNSMLLEDENADKFFTTNNTKENIRTTAWLTDPDEWSAYKNKDAVFAIGTPTIELYCKSFNATATMNDSDEIPILEVGDYGYIATNTSNTQLSADYNNGIYNKTGYNCWLASPNNGSNSQLRINTMGYFGSNAVTTGECSIRPIVCIPTSIFNSKYLNSLIDE